MKIEKISDKQIRCTLNPSDLHSRHLSVRELAYGGEKARKLFHEMLQLASDEVDFNVEDVPLMIEAVPLSSEGIMLIITKIEDPDELDTRFSRFAPSMEGNVPESSETSHEFTGSAGELLESLKNMIKEVLDDPELEEEITASAESAVMKEIPASEPAAAASAGKPDEKKELPPADIISIVVFPSLNQAIQASRVLKGIYDGENTLFKSNSDHGYYLLLHRSGHTPEIFNKICNIMTEYGERRKGHIGTEAYYKEHMEILIAGNAVQTLAQI